MVNYFKQQWEIGRHKEIKDQMNGMRDVMEDVLEDNSMTGQFMTANVVEAILNIRSINQEKKQKEVRNVIRDEKLQVCAIIETHVKAANMSDVYSKVFGRWEWVSNSIVSSNGCSRIVVDHCPAVLSIPEKFKKINSPFRFMNYVADKPEFLPIIQQQWSTPVDGFDVFQKVANMKEKLKISQTKVDANPHDSIIEVEETKILLEYKEAISDENKILSQKAKIDWLRDGDRNSAYFHEVIKGGRMANKIISVCDENGNLVEGELVVAQFARHFQDFLSQSQAVEPIIDIDDLFSTKLTKKDNNLMIKEVTDAEIKEALFDIGDNKSPDGYSMQNATLLTLVLKVSNASKVTEYRPIACCNVLYKCISKIITNRIKSSLNKLVNGNQSTFIPGRMIQDNILLSQELLKGYDRKVGPKRESHGYFKGGRGLRQGDPISPYLFTLVMEVFSLTMQRNVDKNSQFKYNFGCKDLQITHLCFADDLLVLCNGDIGSIRVIKQTLQEFSKASGLVPSLHKSIVFFGSVPLDSQQLILAELLFSVGTLPVRYLGVPLINKRISLNNCKQLVDKVRCKVQDWKNKDLSYAGRLQLVASMLAAMQLYWACVFFSQRKQLGTLIVFLKVFYGVVENCKKALMDITERIIHKFGNGKQVTMRYDNWSVIGPLDQYISMRDIYDARLADYATVAEMTSNGRWKWPEEWLLKFPMLQQCIPSHAFVAWLAIQGRLLTWDRILSWNPDAELKCPLSKKCPDSHNHLFFQCDYSMKVWSTMKRKAKMLILPGDWDGIVNTMRVTEMTPDRLVRSTVGLIPTNELALEGHRIDPSVPSDTVAMFVATDIADQLLELRPSIVTTYSMIAPDSPNFLTTATQAASRGTTDSRSIRSRSHVKLIFSSNVIL
ncbi:RNA-directed DNA polymerase, eukaryota, reverse transcriptase zinc-binding domain protein [Tanacetum coccineum]|uniref:RNA-directed DNA polymerase, eukaryota, reverse transcriptase zinc-binding domain protein n=1 Tax=Tanacetum coccineum TaxID=301880 RepID=A0ABQ5B088_9ASTR